MASQTDTLHITGGAHLTGFSMLMVEANRKKTAAGSLK